MNAVLASESNWTMLGLRSLESQVMNQSQSRSLSFVLFLLLNEETEACCNQISLDDGSSITLDSFERIQSSVVKFYDK